MKIPRLALTAAIITTLGSACDRPIDRETTRRLAELERQANEAKARQQKLEEELAAQQEALARERERAEQQALKAQQQQAEQATLAANQARQLLAAETQLAAREAEIKRLQEPVETPPQPAAPTPAEETPGSGEMDLAGREALAPLPDTQPPPAGHSPPRADLSLFYNSLQPYGDWFETADYGYVWQPALGVQDRSWRPYTRGHWACSDRGWVWISEEPFGWATYHYGRWARCRSHGWIWVPGTQWAPAWVCWRSSGTFIGWAPLPPETLHYQQNLWDASIETTFGIDHAWFVFVQSRHFGSPVHRHCLPENQYDLCFKQTTNVTRIQWHHNRVICGGPLYRDVARQSERRPPFYRIEEERGQRGETDPIGRNHRIEGSRLRVNAPLVDSSNHDHLKPRVTRGRIDRLDIARKEEPKTGNDIRVLPPNWRPSQPSSNKPPGPTTPRREEARKIGNDIRVLPPNGKPSQPSSNKPPGPTTPRREEARKTGNDIRVLPPNWRPSQPSSNKPPGPTTPRREEARKTGNDIRVLPPNWKPSQPPSNKPPGGPTPRRDEAR